MKAKLYVLGLSSVLVSSHAIAQTSGNDLMAVLKGSKDYQTFTILLEKAGTADYLKKGGPYTVLAPTEKAFSRISRRLVITMARNKDQLQKFLAYHVIPGIVKKADLKEGPIKTMQGRDLKVTIVNGRISFNRAKLAKADILASNGVIHAIETPLFPAVSTTTKPSPSKGGTPSGGATP